MNRISLLEFFCICWLIGVFVFGVLFRDGWVRYEFDGELDLSGEVVELVGREGFEQVVRMRDDRFEGAVQVSLGAFPKLFVGDLIEVGCVPSGIDGVNVDGFRYDRYLAKEGVFVLCRTRDGAEVVGQSGSFLSGVFMLRDGFEGVMQRRLAEPYAGLLAGLLYGSRSSLSADLLEEFRRTGTMHIVAVSGYNVMVVANLVLFVLTGLFMKRQTAFWFVLVGIVFFVVLTGADPGVLRAGIMGGLVLIAKQIGRPRSSLMLFLVAGVLMTAYNYRLLLDDAGFQLSFSAALGLVYLSPFMRRFTGFLPGWFGLNVLFAETLSAIVATLPIMLFQFQQFSFVAPFSNLFVVPLIPFAMLFGFVGVIFAFVFEFFGFGLFASFSMVPAYVFLRLILLFVSLFSPLPFLEF